MHVSAEYQDSTLYISDSFLIKYAYFHLKKIVHATHGDN